jgi:uncharacterized protein (DUF924 family)
MDFQTVLAFWFEEIDPAFWWKKDGKFDERLRDRFGAVHLAATRCELFDWRKEPAGRLAEIIVLDQFSRNLYRDSPQAFVNDPLALALAQEAILNQSDLAVEQRCRFFCYMPFMHSESSVIHEIAVRLFSQPGMDSNLEYEQKHKAIIDRFGRYPHRNRVLGRNSTPEELEFLRQPGSSF